MKYKISYRIDGSEDSFIIEGGSIEELQRLAKEGLKKRGLDEDAAWSEPADRQCLA